MSKILFLDIETFPNTVRTWGMYKQHALELVEESIVCGYSAKWLNGKQTTRTLYDLKGYKPDHRDDQPLIEEIWTLENEADIVVAHYGDGFDIPRLNARFLRHGFQPPAPFKTVDTKKEACRLFNFGGSYKLDYICSYLGLGQKMDTGGYSLWQGCMAGDPSSWAKMKKYNKHDVVLLERLYLHLLPWLNNHPSQFVEGGCPKCGSTNLQSRGFARSNTRQYRRFQCQDCGGWTRSTKSEGKVTLTHA